MVLLPYWQLPGDGEVLIMTTGKLPFLFQAPHPMQGSHSLAMWVVLYGSFVVGA
jgi:hypothetical protein